MSRVLTDKEKQERIEYMVRFIKTTHSTWVGLLTSKNKSRQDTIKMDMCKHDLAMAAVELVKWLS